MFLFVKIIGLMPAGFHVHVTIVEFLELKKKLSILNMSFQINFTFNWALKVELYISNITDVMRYSKIKMAKKYIVIYLY